MLPNSIRNSRYLDPIKARKWEVFCHPPDVACVPVVREFFANSPDRINGKIFVRGVLVKFGKHVINDFYGLPTLGYEEGDEEGYLRLLTDIDIATVSATICKPGMVWKMAGDAYKHFPRKGLVDTIRPWYAFVCANLQPTTHLVM